MPMCCGKKAGQAEIPETITRPLNPDNQDPDNPGPEVLRISWAYSAGT